MDKPGQADAVGIRYGADDEYMGRLHVRARFEGFEGCAEAWIDRQEFSEFAERLSEYPLSEPATFSTGMGGIEFIGLSVNPRGGKGQVTVLLHLASETWDNGKPVTVHEATIEFPTSYEYLRRISGDLHGVLDGAWGEAMLSPDVLI